MKKLLSVYSLIGVISLGALSAYAQSTPPAQNERPTRDVTREHKFDPAARAAHLQKALQLSDEQTAKITKVFEDSRQQRQSITEKYKPQFDAFHADMEHLREQTHTQLDSVLTPKQQQALDAQRNAHGDRHGHGKRRDGNRHDRHPH